MNILLVTMCMDIGGAETHILELAKGLKNSNNNVYVMSNGGEYVDELVKNGIGHIVAPMHNRSFLNILKSCKILKKTIIDKKINIVHAHARIPAMIANNVCRKLNIPFVTTAHGVYKVDPILRKLTKWGSKTIAVSDDIKKYLIDEYGVKEENIIITVNGIDTKKFAPNIGNSEIKNELNLIEGRKKIVHVSRLSKETSLVAQLLIRLAEKIDDVDVIIIGDGDSFNSLKIEADTANRKLQNSRIIMTGARTDIDKILDVADVFVGVSRAALEAMAEEKATILAGNQGYLGVFEEEKLEKALETNFCCRGLELPEFEKIEHDVKGILCKNADEIGKMGKFNRSIVEKYYSVDRMVDDAIRVYEKINV